jgi:hypothetical protein
MHIHSPSDMLHNRVALRKLFTFVINETDIGTLTVVNVQTKLVNHNFVSIMLQLLTSA